jgi:hypothetical protein
MNRRIVRPVHGAAQRKGSKTEHEEQGFVSSSWRLHVDRDSQCCEQFHYAAVLIPIHDRLNLHGIVCFDRRSGIFQSALNEAPVAGVRQIGLPRIKNNLYHRQVCSPFL